MHFWLGTINTGVLLTSSLTMALAVHAAQEGDRTRLIRFLGATLGLGVLFLFIKGMEYRSEWIEHLVPGSGFRVDRPDADRVELFFVFYFIMTGLHALHMLIGISILTVLLIMARGGRFSKEY